MAWFSRIIRWASVVRAGKDTDSYPVQQIVYLGKTADAVMVFPYGLHANVDGDALGPLLVLNGNEENRGMLPTSMTRRSTLSSGDVELYSPVSRSRVTMRANGDVEVNAKANMVATVGGDATITATGSLAATAADATVTAPTITLDGNVFITGGLTMSGGGAADFGTGTMTHDGKVVDSTHGHVQGNDGGGDDEAPINGVT